MLLRQIFDPKLAQYAYLIGCQQTGEALIIDPERDIDRYVVLAQAEGLHITAVAETHIHADFLSGAREFAEQHDVKLYLSDEGGPDWKYEWAAKGHYNTQLLRDGDTFQIGKIDIQAVHTPGHTPEHLSFLVTDRGGGAEEPIGLVSGDFVFVGDLGRPDLLESAAGVAGQMEPSARSLFHSVTRFLDLPEFTQIWPAHGAGSACGKALGAVPSSTVGYELRHNAAIAAARRGEDFFVASILEGQPEPPLYFATMKRLNKVGPPVLGSLPLPLQLTPAQVEETLDRESTVIVDTRRDRGAFMARHLEGSLFAPLNTTFPTIVGSYVRHDEAILLVIEEGRVEEAVRDLVRIGFDSVVGFIPPEMLDEARLAKRLRQTPVTDFTEVQQAQGRPGTTVLDVRRAAEYAEGHVPGAINIAHTRLLDRLGEVPQDGTIFVYCRSGARASAATSLLEREGRKATHVDDDVSRFTALKRES